MKVQKSVIPIILTFLSILSCSDKKPCNCTVNEEINAYNDSLLENQAWDNSIWSQLGISDLKEDKIPGYRMLVLPNWPDTMNGPTLYYLINDSISPKLIVRHYSRISNWNPQLKITYHSDTFAISIDEIADFNRSVEENCFWTMLVSEPQVLDGIYLSIEGYSIEPNACTERRYHHTEVFTSTNKAFFNVTNRLIKLEREKEDAASKLERGAIEPKLDNLIVTKKH